MATDWERYLERWSGAGLIEPTAVERIRAYETERTSAQGLHWTVRLAISLGGLLLGAGVLLFVAAHWDTLSPAARFGLVLALVASFHVAGTLVVERFAVLAGSLHAIGTASLGAGIFLAGQIFHLQEHWPSGLLLWALGAWVGWTVLRDGAQATFVALLTPLWLGGEWIVATGGSHGHEAILAEGVLLLAITYLTALLPGKDTPTRQALSWIGGIALLPLTFTTLGVDADAAWFSSSLPRNLQLLGWLSALGLPLALALWLRGVAAWKNVLAALWVVLLGAASRPRFASSNSSWQELEPYGLCALGAIGLIAWGLHEARKEHINLGVAGFAITVLFFYFSTVMDKLGRSASLIGLGTLFLLGGWLLEKTRRRLVARLESQESPAQENTTEEAL